MIPATTVYEKNGVRVPCCGVFHRIVSRAHQCAGGDYPRSDDLLESESVGNFQSADGSHSGHGYTRRKPDYYGRSIEWGQKRAGGYV